MLNIKYNFLAGAGVVLALVNAALLVRVFGVSPQTDAYFIAQSAAGALQLAQLLLTEQFMYFYNDVKTGGAEKGHDFYAFALFLSLCAGAVFFAGVSAGAGQVGALFAGALDPGRARTLVSLLTLLSITLLFAPAIALNEALLNAERRFGRPYALNLLPGLLMLGVLLYCRRADAPDIRLLAGSAAAASLLVFLAGLELVRRAGVPIRLRARHPLAVPFIRNSVSMRFGHSLHHFFSTLITNNVLAALSAGAASHFGYAQRVLQILYNVAAGPSARMYASRVSALWSGGDAAGIRSAMRRYLRTVPPLLLAAVAAAYLLLPPALKLVAGNGLAPEDIGAIRFLFLCTAAWYMILATEAGFTVVCVAERNSRLFIKTNAVFSLVYFAIVLLAREKLGAFSIPLGLAAAQAVNLAVYSRAALRRLAETDARGGRLHA